MWMLTFQSILNKDNIDYYSYIETKWIEIVLKRLIKSRLNY